LRHYFFFADRPPGGQLNREVSGPEILHAFAVIPPLTLPSTVDISINSRLLSIGKRIPSAGAFLEVLAATSQRPRDAPTHNKLTGSFLRASV
jgi:hypothetical protein